MPSARVAICWAASTSRNPARGDGAEGKRSLVVQCEGDVRVLHQDIVAQDGGVAST